MFELTADFETHWEDEYTLSKMTTAEYIRDPRFHVHGIGLKLGTAPAVWVEGPHVEAALAAIPWAHVRMIGHNLMFDGAVLAWRYGHRPAQYRDTLGMARALIGTKIRKHGLDEVASHLGIGGKVGYDYGEAAALAAVKGVRNPDPESMKALGFYCATAPNSDVNLTRAVYDRLAPQMPEAEWKVLDWTIRAFTTPMLELDADKLAVYKDEVIFHKLHLCRELGLPRTEISSNDRFAAHLKARGVKPPMKFSPTTKKQTFAFAKGDFDFTQLANEHPDPFVRQLVEARLEVKSSIEETRAAKLLGIARTGSMPVPLAYSGAMNTHRQSGTGGYNLQNLKRGGTLRDAIIAPEGHVILAADLSNIELRVALALANSTAKLDILRHGGDLYCETASSLFGHRVYPEKHEFYREEMKQHRTVGKVCIAEGQQVLTLRGYCPIEDVRADDRLWDGVDWVSHGGVVCNGVREVMRYDGVTGTEDHVVFLDWGGTCSLGEAARTGRRIRRVAPEATGGVHVADTRGAQVGRPGVVGCDMLGVPDSVRRGPLERGEWEVEVLPVVRSPPAGSGMADEARERHGAAVPQPEEPSVQELRGARRGVPVPQRAELRAMDTGEPRTASRHGAGPGGQQRTLRAGEPEVVHEGGEQPQQAHNEGPYADGCEPVCSDNHREVAAFGHDAGADSGTREARGAGEAEGVAHHCGEARVYDIVNCGPRHRYTVNGRLVHNCDLSLQYGAAHLAFQGMLRVMAKQNWDEDRCKQTVDVWRANNPLTTRRWRECGEALKRMVLGVQPLDWQISTAGGRSVFTWEQGSILLPRGLRIKYPNIRHHFPVDENGEVAKYPEVVYDDARSTEGFVRIYSGKCFENLCQALATNVFLDQVVQINDVWPVAMTVHDEAILVVPGEKVEAVMMFVKRIMGTSPTWWPDLPLASSAAYGRSYGDAK